MPTAEHSLLAENVVNILNRNSEESEIQIKPYCPPAPDSHKDPQIQPQFFQPALVLEDPQTRPYYPSAPPEDPPIKTHLTFTFNDQSGRGDEGNGLLLASNVFGNSTASDFSAFLQ